jgi:hypothetical protein
MGPIKNVSDTYTMMDEYNIDPVTWYSERELKFTPKHFVVTNTKLTEEARHWIMNTLRGRFSIIHKNTESEFLQILGYNGYPAFEDPKEAITYELVWS